MEGRDIGSIFQATTVFSRRRRATRAARRAEEGQTDSIASVTKWTTRRQPLVCPKGATQIDTAHHTLEELSKKLHIHRILTGFRPPSSFNVRQLHSNPQLTNLCAHLQGISPLFMIIPRVGFKMCSRRPVIFAANHVSFYDPPAIGACIHRPINYFARDTLFKGLG